MTQLVVMLGIAGFSLGVGVVGTCLLVECWERLMDWRRSHRARLLRRRQSKQAAAELSQLLTSARRAMWQEARQIPQPPEVWDA